VGTYGKISIHAEHPAMKVRSNGVLITEANSPVVSPNKGSKTSAVLVQSQLKGVNKVILSEGEAIPAFFETRTGLGPGLGLEENPDSRKTRTRTRKKSGLVFKKTRT
jgi:hypothetical protein